MLQVTTFGELTISLNDAPVSTFASRKAQALLIYLLYTQQSHAREVLAELLWDDRGPKQAAGNLRVLLSNLRQLFPDYIDISRHSVDWSPTQPYVCDALVFREHLQAVQQHLNAGAELNTALAERLQQAAKIAAGEFLPGFVVRDSSGFEAWLEATRYELQAELIYVLSLLATWYVDTGAFQVGLETARRLLSLDPYRDESNRVCMQLLLRSGERSAALEHYEQFRTLLETELGLQPDHATQALYNQLLQSHTVRSSYQPQSAAPFIGRSAEMQHVQGLLKTQEVRCVTLFGPGGVGKTRLAREVVLELEQHWPDGIVWISFQALATLSAWIQMLADACDIPLIGRKSSEQQVLDYLAEKSMLLVFDNAELALAGRDFLQLLLDKAPQISVLVTSRERLHLPDEWVVELYGLVATPSWTPQAQDGSAQQLFWAAAQRVIPDWEPTSSEYHHLAAICRLVDGLPLALEMAAAWLQVLTVPDIAAELQQSLDFLVHAHDRDTERHQSLRAVFEHSWRLLSLDERQMLSGLALFHGSCTPEAAEVVCHASLEQLNSFAAKSLIYQMDSQRFAMHNVVRQFALRHGQTDPVQWQALETRLCDYMAAWLQQQYGYFHSVQALEIVHAIGADIDTIRFVWSQAVVTQAVTTLQSMLEILGEWHDIRGFYREGIELLQEALVEDWNAHPALHAMLLMRCGWFHFRVAEFPISRQMIEQALEILKQSSLIKQQVQVYCALANVCYAMGAHSDAWKAAEQALETARDVQDLLGCARALNSLGVIANAQGRYKLAYDLHLEAWEFHQKVRHPWMQAGALHNLAVVARSLGYIDTAHDFYHQSLSLRRRLHDRRGMALCLNNLANLASVQRDWGESRRLFQESLRLYRELGDRAGIALVLHNLGDVALHEEQWLEANTLLQRSLSVRREINDQRGLAYTLAALGKAETRLRQWQVAWNHLIEGWELALRLKTMPIALEILSYLAELYLLHDQYDISAQILTVVRSHPSRDSQHDEYVADLWQRVSSVLPARQLASIQVSLDDSLEELGAHLPALQRTSMYNGDMSWV